MDGNLKCRLLSMRGSGMHTILLFDYDFAWISINPGREVRIFVQHTGGLQSEPVACVAANWLDGAFSGGDLIMVSVPSMMSNQSAPI